jgi:hypothetical protein
MFAPVVESEPRAGHTQTFDAPATDTVAAITRNEPGAVGMPDPGQPRQPRHAELPRALSRPRRVRRG